MLHEKEYKKRQLLRLGCYLVSFVMCACWSFIRLNHVQREQSVNRARLIVREECAYVQDCLKNGEQNWRELSDTKYLVTLIGLDGEILLDTKQPARQGKSCEIESEIQMDHFFCEQERKQIRVSFPIKNAGTVVLFAVFEIPESEFGSSLEQRTLYGLMPLIGWGVFVIINVLGIVLSEHKRLVRPLVQMEQATTDILRGDYSRKIRFEKDKMNPMVERLGNQFELMRDELYVKSLREEQLKKEQKELLSCMSHDLRTPITTIQAHTEAILDGIYRTPEKQKEALEVILRKAHTLNDMIAKLLEHSNTELHQLSIEPKECYQKQFFDMLATELFTYCGKRSCSFTYENSCQELMVRMDEGRITEVIYNLIENACKYMENREGQIILRCMQLMEEQRILIEIEDNGVGIAMEDIPYVFDRFYRAEKSRSMQIPGTGLGLSICKYIIEQHQGEIEIESHKGQGTIVRFTLPY